MTHTDYNSTRNNLLALRAAVQANDLARVSELMVEHIAVNLPLGPIDV
jgi:hypothetical protein